MDKSVFALTVAVVLLGSGMAYLLYQGSQSPAAVGEIQYSGGQTTPAPAAVGGCSQTDPTKIGASVQDSLTGATPPATINYSLNGAGWYSVSGSSTDSRSQGSRVTGLQNASPLIYFMSKVDKVPACGSDAVPQLAVKLNKNSTIAVSVFNDDYTLNNQSQKKAIGSGGSADFKVRISREVADAFLTNPDLANFGVSPYLLVSSNMSATTFDRTQTALSAMSGNMKVVEKSFLAPASASDQTIVWKVEGNLDNAAPVAEFNVHLVAKTGQDPGAINATIEFRPVTWYHNQRSNTIEYGVEDELGNGLWTMADCAAHHGSTGGAACSTGGAGKAYIFTT